MILTLPNYNISDALIEYITELLHLNVKCPKEESKGPMYSRWANSAKTFKYL